MVFGYFVPASPPMTSFRVCLLIGSVALPGVCNITALLSEGDEGYALTWINVVSLPLQVSQFSV